MNLINLSKLSLIEQELNKSNWRTQIPNCVIQEILNSYVQKVPNIEDISDDLLLSRIRILSKTHIIKPYDLNDLRILARFINSSPNSHWNQERLEQSFEFFQLCLNKNFRNQLCITSFTKIGLPTNENPFSLSSTTLFALILDRGLKYSKELSELDMFIIIYQNYWTTAITDPKHKLQDYFDLYNDRMYKNHISSEKYQFLPGKQTAIDMNNKETVCDLISISSLNDNECVSYGKQGQFFMIYTYQELKNMFYITKSLCLPNLAGKRGYINLDNDEINQLLTICSNNQELELFKIINMISNLTKFQLDQTKIIKNWFSIEPNLVGRALYKLHELSMYMRGWSGEGILPIKTGYNNLDTELKVTQGFLEFEASVQKCQLYDIQIYDFK